MGPGPQVLLVQDSPKTSRAIATILTEGCMGAQVIIVTDSAAAVAQLGADAFDLVVLDLALPDGHGLALLADVKDVGLPAVVLSGLADPEVVQRSYDLGADCFVRNPRRISELVPAVRAIEQFWMRRATIDDGHPRMFQLPLVATADAVRETRFVVRKLLDGWGLGTLDDTAELCASELATNAVLHARSPVLLGVELLDQAVRFEVEDEVPGEVAPGELVHDEETGRGLALVDMLSESWGVRQNEGGKTVWFELRRPDIDVDPPRDSSPGS